MGKPIVVAILGDNRGLKKSLGDSGSALGRFGKTAAVGLGAAAVAVGGFAVAAVKSASDAQQSYGATETVFGKFAQSVIANSNKAANAVGLSANEYRENANLIGSLFKNQGVASDELAAKTDNMVKLGADLAATFGGPTKDAVAALGSAFKGEYDPLERFGISIKKSAINARLAANGQDKLTGAALKAAEQQATTALIMEQAADSVGAFGRESDTLAGQQQRLGAKVEDLKAKVGAGLLPILTNLATFASEKLLPALEDFGGWFGENIMPKLRIFGEEVETRVLPIIGKIAGFIKNELIPAIRPLVEKWLEGARKGQEQLNKKLKDAAPFLDLAKAAFKGLWNVIKNVLLPVLGEFYKTALPKIGFLLGIVAEALGRVGQVGIAMWNGILAPVFRKMSAAIALVLDQFASMLRVIGQVPTMGWADDLAADLEGAAGKARDVRDSIRNIPKSKTVTISFRTTAQDAAAGAILGAFSGARNSTRTASSGSRTTTSTYSRTVASPSVASTPQVVELTVKVDPVFVNPVEIGRQTAAALRAYYGNGGARP